MTKHTELLNAPHSVLTIISPAFAGLEFPSFVIFERPRHRHRWVPVPKMAPRMHPPAVYDRDKESTDGLIEEGDK